MGVQGCLAPPALLIHSPVPPYISPCRSLLPDGKDRHHFHRLWNIYLDDDIIHAYVERLWRTFQGKMIHKQIYKYQPPLTTVIAVSLTSGDNLILKAGRAATSHRVYEKLSAQRANRICINLAAMTKAHKTRHQAKKHGEEVNTKAIREAASSMLK